MRLALIVLLCVCVQGCGHKGDLFLPEAPAMPSQSVQGP